MYTVFHRAKTCNKRIELLSHHVVMQQLNVHLLELVQNVSCTISIHGIHRENSRTKKKRLIIRMINFILNLFVEF